MKPLRAPSIRSINARRIGINEGQGHIWLSQLSLPDIAFLWTITHRLPWNRNQRILRSRKKGSYSRPEEFWSIMSVDWIFRILSGLRRLERNTYTFSRNISMSCKTNEIAVSRGLKLNIALLLVVNFTFLKRYYRFGFLILWTARHRRKIDDFL